MGAPSRRPVAVWFRRDLRLADNPALCAAVAGGSPVLPLYIHDSGEGGEWRLGSASKWWLHHSLLSLSASLDGGLCVLSGDCRDILSGLDVGAVYFNRCHEPWRRALDAEVCSMLASRGVDVLAFDGSLLFDPEQAVKADGSPYKVFTPFYKKACLAGVPPRVPVVAPSGFPVHSCAGGVSVASLGLLPSVDWCGGMEDEWSPGEAGARRLSRGFIDAGEEGYAFCRDYPSVDGVSRLSPHLAFGEISPNSLWHRLPSDHPFLRQLCWREFSCNLLHHFPRLPHANFRAAFDKFPWRSDDDALSRWQRGMTGYPMVDAGMREL